MTKSLYCKYESMGMAYYAYGPRKVEVVSLRPYIAVIHEFITDSETKMMIDVSCFNLFLNSILMFVIVSDRFAKAAAFPNGRKRNERNP